MDQNEKLVTEFLEERNFTCFRFPEEDIGKHLTPDFRVYRGTQFCFFCEVKSIDKDIWLDQQLSTVPPGTIAGGLRPDPTFNRLTTDIHNAIKQFDAVNGDLKYPNVLAFVNNEFTCGVHDLYEVFTGNCRGENGLLYPFSKKYSDGRIKEEKERIHMFLWIDKCKKNHNFMFSNLQNTHCRSLCTLFGKDPDLIKRY